MLDLAIPQERVQYIVDQLVSAFPEAAEVDGYERIPVRGVPESKAHVLAAAIRGRAQLIVAEDIADYPADALVPYRIEAMGVDDFLRDLLDVDPERMIDVLEMLSGCRQLPTPMTIEGFLDMLEAGRCPGFAADAREALRSAQSGT